MKQIIMQQHTSSVLFLGNLKMFTSFFLIFFLFLKKNKKRMEKVEREEKEEEENYKLIRTTAETRTRSRRKR